MSTNEKENLIVVYCKETKKYANYLQQLIASKDDFTDKDGTTTTRGIKDGSVSCAIWSKEQYFDNEARMSSENYVLFLDSKNTFEDETSFMVEAFNKYGMHYKYLGTKGCLFVDDSVLNQTEYDEFVAYCKKVVNELGAKKIEEIEPQANKMNKKVKVSLAIASLIAPVAIPLALPAVIAGGIAGIAGGKAIDNKVKASKTAKDMLQEEYTCLILKFYLDGLKAFLDMVD